MTYPNQTHVQEDVIALLAENDRLRRRLESSERRAAQRRDNRLERLERVAEAGGLAVFDWMDTSRDEVYFTPQAYRVLGHEPYSFIPSWATFLQCVHALDRDGFDTSVRRAIYEADAITTEIRVRRADGGYHYVEFSAQATRDPNDDYTRLTGALRDIDRQHRDRGEVALSQERLSLVVKGSRAGVWDWPNMANDDVHYSPGLHRLLGYDPEVYSITTEILWGLIHAEDVAAVQEAIDMCRETGVDFEVEYRIRFHGRGYRWVRSAGALVCDRDGVARRLTGAIFDVHEARSATLPSACPEAPSPPSRS